MMFGDLLLYFNNELAAISDEGQSITYFDLHTHSEKIYYHIKHRCLIFCLCKNEIGSLAGYVSFLSKKIVPLLLDASLEKESLQKLIVLYKPAFIWLPADRLEDFPTNEKVYECYGYALIRCMPATSFTLHEELALLFTTSGSTGSPKLVRISYENLISNATAIAQYLSITKDERPVTVLPMHYSYGLSVINSHLIKGATILLTGRSLMEKQFWVFVKNECATSLPGVPYTYEILKKLRFTSMDLPSVNTLTQAGGKLSDALCEEFADYCSNTGKNFFMMYGQTEATARMSYLPPEFSLTKIGSIGKPIPGGRFELVDEKNAVIEQSNVTGELVYYGKNVSMGYAYSSDDLKNGDENKGVLYTHDLAVRDADGFYFIKGRKNRFIKLFGNRIGLDETEELVKNIVDECACVGEDDNMLIYITDPTKEAEVCTYLSTKTGINRKAFSVRYINAIPKNTSGKTLYSNLAIS
jgi:acyl-coenzyme A synthetase/AMP-(fatty) acid ligase